MNILYKNYFFIFFINIIYCKLDPIVYKLCSSTSSQYQNYFDKTSIDYIDSQVNISFQGQFVIQRIEIKNQQLTQGNNYFDYKNFFFQSENRYLSEQERKLFQTIFPIQSCHYQDHKQPIEKVQKFYIYFTRPYFDGPLNSAVIFKDIRKYPISQRYQFYYQMFQQIKLVHENGYSVQNMNLNTIFIKKIINNFFNLRIYYDRIYELDSLVGIEQIQSVFSHPEILNSEISKIKTKRRYDYWSISLIIVAIEFGIKTLLIDVQCYPDKLLQKIYINFTKKIQANNTDKKYVFLEKQQKLQENFYTGYNFACFQQLKRQIEEKINLDLNQCIFDLIDITMSKKKKLLCYFFYPIVYADLPQETPTLNEAMKNMRELLEILQLEQLKVIKETKF